MISLPLYFSTEEAADYVTSDQFNALNGRYTAALADYNEIWDIDDNVQTAESAATLAATAVSDAQKLGLNQFMLMGL